MWSKTAMTVIGGCVLSISLLCNLNFMMPLNIDIRLFMGLLLSFPLWVAIVIWCACSDNVKQALKRCTVLFIPSVMFNALFLMN